jgi:hypothetical protein
MRCLLPLMLLAVIALPLVAAEPQLDPSDDRRKLVEDAVRRALVRADEIHRVIEFRYRSGDQPQPATVTASDATTLSLRVDGAVLRLPWKDLPDFDLHSLGEVALTEGTEKRLMLGRFAFAAGHLDQADTDFRRLAAEGQRLPPEAKRMDERRLELAHAARERLAAEAWDQLAPLLNDPAKRDEARSRVAVFERNYEDTTFIIDKRPQIVAWRAGEP